MIGDKLPYAFGLSEILVGLSWGILALRLWRDYKRTKGEIAEFFLSFSFLLSVAFFIFALGDFFLSSPVLIIGTFFLTLSFSFLSYLFTRIIFSNISPWWGFLFIFILGMVSISLSIFLPFVPTLTQWGELYLKFHPLVGVLIFLIIISSSLPLGVIIIQKGLSFQSKEEKTKSLGLGILCLSGLPIAFFYSMGIFGDGNLLAVIIWSIGIILLSILTQKSFPSPLVKSKGQKLI